MKNGAIFLIWTNMCALLICLFSAVPSLMLFDSPESVSRMDLRFIVTFFIFYYPPILIASMITSWILVKKEKSRWAFWIGFISLLPGLILLTLAIRI